MCTSICSYADLFALRHEVKPVDFLPSESSENSLTHPSYDLFKTADYWRIQDKSHIHSSHWEYAAGSTRSFYVLPLKLTGASEIRVTESLSPAGSIVLEALGALRHHLQFSRVPVRYSLRNASLSSVA